MKIRISTPLLALALVLALMMSMTACTKKEKTGDSSSDSSAVTGSDIDAGTVDSDSGKAMGLETVHFAYDSSNLDSGAKATLKNNATILKDKTSVRVQIEGNTDERGGIQYNLALGERRANSVKAYLVDMGVSAERVSTISYGKEKPLDMGHDESAWAKNRRANFRITEK